MYVFATNFLLLSVTLFRITWQKKNIQIAVLTVLNIVTAE